MDLKTLGQFNLLGDPSIHPAVIASATSVPKGVDADQSKRDGAARNVAPSCARMGELLQETKPTASQKAGKVRKSATVQKALANIARKAGIGAREGVHGLQREDAEGGASARQQGGAGGIPLLRRGLPA